MGESALTPTGPSQETTGFAHDASDNRITSSSAAAARSTRDRGPSIRSLIPAITTTRSGGGRSRSRARRAATCSADWPAIPRLMTDHPGHHGWPRWAARESPVRRSRGEGGSGSTGGRVLRPRGSSRSRPSIASRRRTIAPRVKHPATAMAARIQPAIVMTRCEGTNRALRSLAVMSRPCPYRQDAARHPRGAGPSDRMGGRRERPRKSRAVGRIGGGTDVAPYAITCRIGSAPSTPTSFLSSPAWK